MSDYEFEDYGDLDEDVEDINDYDYTEPSTTEQSLIQEDGDSTMFDFIAHTMNDAEDTINRSAKEVAELLGISVGDASVFLRTYRWDKDRFLEDFYTDPDKISGQVGIPVDQKPPPIPKGDIECLICFDDVPAKKCHSLSCGHFYCNNCWTTYVSEKLKEGKNCLTCTCPHPKCNASCSSDTFGMFLSPKQFEKYNRINLESYVEFALNRKWCPSPECKNFLELTSSKLAIPVECKCGFRFCFHCNDYEIGDHAPADCQEVENWLKKAASESENLKWMDANTKKCPQCNSHIEKNGGCMHMTCRKCSHEFCWLCRKNWRGHSACNINQQTKDEDIKAVQAKNELEHYLFFFHRYESHRTAMKIADEQRRGARERAELIMDKLGVRAQDVKFIYEATEQLLRNRNMLQYSYVYAYYLSERRIRSTEKDLFEYLQKYLEHHTDKLSELYEKSADDIQRENNSFLKWKEEVTNYTRVSKKFLDNFTAGVILKTLTHPEGDSMTEDERFYIVQLETLESMGLDRSFCLPLLVKYDGNVEQVIATIFR